MLMCSDLVLDHFESPRNVGALESTEPNVGTGWGGTVESGDVCRIQIRVNETGIIEEAKFKTQGNGFSIALGSWLTEIIRGKTVHEGKDIHSHQLIQHFSLPQAKHYCAILVEKALKAAIANYEEKMA